MPSFSSRLLRASARGQQRCLPVQNKDWGAADALRQNTRGVCGSEPEIWAVPCDSSLRNFIHDTGIPAVNAGVGGYRVCHNPDEFIRGGRPSGLRAGDNGHGACSARSFRRRINAQAGMNLYRHCPRGPRLQPGTAVTGRDGSIRPDRAPP